MKYQVLDCGRPADCNHHSVDPSWDCSTFSSVEEAITYANKWLGMYGPYPHSDVGQYDYSGYGSILEIKEKK